MGHDVVSKSSCHYRRCNRGEMVTNETLRHVQGPEAAATETEAQFAPWESHSFLFS